LIPSDVVRSTADLTSVGAFHVIAAVLPVLFVVADVTAIQLAFVSAKQLSTELYTQLCKVT
jgi:hypothetical protein